MGIAQAYPIGRRRAPETLKANTHVAASGIDFGLRNADSGKCFPI